MTADVDVAVIGAGVVGAAIAAQLAPRASLWLLDGSPRTGGETSERNSGVIHAGLYYPADSWKTRLCVEGNRLLYSWAAEHSVPHRRCGKLIVAATPADEIALGALQAHAGLVGAQLHLLTRHQLVELEPEVVGSAAAWSPATGIVDAYALTQSLVQAAREAGAEILVSAGVRQVENVSDGYILRTERGDVTVRTVVNAAGLEADSVAAMVGVTRYRIHPCRGDYFRLRGAPRFSHLVYPVRPRGAPGLGVHLTLDLAGGCRLGPDARYVNDRHDYRPPADESASRARFVVAARRYLPHLREEDLVYDSCGIRPKLRAPDEPDEHDFAIAEDLPRWINLVGIESPGLTAALALAAEVERMVFG